LAGLRVRRSREAARQAILDAAEAIMLAEGPDAVTVTRVAEAVGVTDAAVHYHFGSRMGLIRALLRHAGRGLVRAIVKATRPADQRLDLAAVSAAMRQAYATDGGAQMAVWLQLAGWRPQGTGMLSPLVARAEAAGGRDARRLLALLSAAHMGVALLGEALLRAADLPYDEAGRDAFLDWVTETIERALTANDRGASRT
jgi:AcrR family transcriptional regulator